MQLESSEIPAPHWCLPCLDLVKINVDASIDVNQGVSGFGIIARNLVGEVLVDGSML